MSLNVLIRNYVPVLMITDVNVSMFNTHKRFRRYFLFVIFLIFRKLGYQVSDYTVSMTGKKAPSKNIAIKRHMLTMIASKFVRGQLNKHLFSNIDFFL